MLPSHPTTRLCPLKSDPITVLKPLLLSHLPSVMLGHYLTWLYLLSLANLADNRGEYLREEIRCSLDPGLFDDACIPCGSSKSYRQVTNVAMLGFQQTLNGQNDPPLPQHA
jgi:hypothetical protein